jgi:hypothetical protein
MTLTQKEIDEINAREGYCEKHDMDWHGGCPQCHLEAFWNSVKTEPERNPENNE